MDPLRVTTSVLALAGAVYKGAAEIRRIVGTLKGAPESLLDLAEEVQLIQGALRGVEAALCADPDAIVRFEIDDVFATAIKGSRATLACINKEFELLFCRSDWKARFLVLWKEEDMTKLLGQLDRKRGSILLLIQLLSLRSIWEVRSGVAQNQRSLDIAKQDITDLIPSYPSCRQTILESLDNKTADSILGDRESVLSTTEFDFDFELINTRTYRRALAKATLHKHTQKLPEETHLRSSGSSSSSSSSSGKRSSLLSRVAEEDERDARPFEGLIVLSWEPEAKPMPNQQSLPKVHHGLEGLNFDASGMTVGLKEDPRPEPPSASGSDDQDMSEPSIPLEEVRLPKAWDEPNLLPQSNDSDDGRMASDRDQYGVPTDGTPITIRTRGHRKKSQTSLLIEHFEGAKDSSKGTSKRPSVRSLGREKYAEEYDDDYLAPAAPLPLMSEINPSEMTSVRVRVAPSRKISGHHGQITPEVTTSARTSTKRHSDDMSSGTLPYSSFTPKFYPNPVAGVLSHSSSNDGDEVDYCSQTYGVKVSSEATAMMNGILQRMVEENDRLTEKTKRRMEENKMEENDGLMEKTKRRMEETKRRTEETKRRMEENTRRMEETKRRTEETKRRMEENTRRMEETTRRIEESKRLVEKSERLTYGGL